MTSLHEAETDTLYYDGQCPICSAEVKKLVASADDAIEFVDLHSADVPLPKAVLETRLHLRRAGGEWVKGLEANIIAWQHTPKHRVASVLLLPGIKQMASLGYRLWLVWYQWQRKRRVTRS